MTQEVAPAGRGHVSNPGRISTALYFYLEHKAYGRRKDGGTVWAAQGPNAVAACEARVEEFRDNPQITFRKITRQEAADLGVDTEAKIAAAARRTERYLKAVRQYRRQQARRTS